MTSFRVGTPAKFKRMWVAESGRGLGVGRRILGELESGSSSLQLDVNLVADLQSDGAEQLSTQAECEDAASGRHGVGVELQAVELSTNPHLLETAELSRDSFGDVDDSESPFELRPEVTTFPRNPEVVDPFMPKSRWPLTVTGA